MSLLLGLILSFQPLQAQVSTTRDSQNSDLQIIKTFLKSLEDKNAGLKTPWLKLLHYHQTTLGSWESGIDDPEFFLAKNGKYDPEKELIASIKKLFYKDFFVKDLKDKKALKASENETPPQAPLQSDKQAPQEKPEEFQPAQCRYISRYYFLRGIINNYLRDTFTSEVHLKDKIHYWKILLPAEPDCKRFRDWKSSINPQGLSLIFPATYINNPASMFGHALLRLDATTDINQDALLGYSVSYSANTTESSGFIFALNGLTGGYFGGYTVEPYYKTVKNYNDLESRNMWEYKLNFSREELDKLMLHLWEVTRSYSYYYFFDANCASALLEIIEAVKPELNLMQQFSFWAIPSEVVRSVANEPGLLHSTQYRPSSTEIMEAQSKNLTEEEVELAMGIAKAYPTQIRSVENTSENITDSQELATKESCKRSEILDLSYEFLNYQTISGKIEEDKSAKIRHKILVEKSTLPNCTPVLPPVPRARPDEGHESDRLDMGIGVQRFEKSKIFSQFAIRPVYHDIFDRPAGYVSGTSINIFKLAFRQLEEGKLRLENFVPLEIYSLSPRLKTVKPLSWNFGIGSERKYFDRYKDPLVTSLRIGPGLTYKFFDRMSSSLLVDNSFMFSTHLLHNHALALIPKLINSIEISDNLRWGIIADYKKGVIGDKFSGFELGSTIDYSLTQDFSIRANLSRKKDYQDTYSESLLSLNYYF